MQDLEMRQTIGGRLRAARLAVGMSQRGVSADLKKSQQTIAAWENGRQIPNVFDLRNLCTLYAITPNHVLLEHGWALPIMSVAAHYAVHPASGASPTPDHRT